MYVAIVNVWVGADALPRVVIGLATERTFRTYAHQMPLVDALHHGRGLGQPCLELRQNGLIEGARLVANLPRHDGGVVCIAFLGVAVGAFEDETEVIEEELLRQLVGGELRGVLDVGRITHLVRLQCLARSCVFEVETITSAPLPRVI